MKDLPSHVMVKDWMLSPYNPEQDKNTALATFIHLCTGSCGQRFKQEKEIKNFQFGKRK